MQPHDGHDVPDIVFLDFNLPDVCDLRLLDALHAEAPLTKIVLMSGQMTEDIADDARKHGAFAVLTKPFDLEAAVRIQDPDR